MEPIAVIIIAIMSAVAGMGIAAFYFYFRNEPVIKTETKTEDESTIEFVETFKEILLLQANKIEADFIQRIKAQAEEILTGKDTVKPPDNSGQSGDNPNNYTP